jgi:glycosyltransferase involved in cell wall biosynthesis
MRVLVSAYACEPGKGSEPGVGWNWVKQIARRHEVWVITRANNRQAIEQELADRRIDNLHFCFFDLPGWLRFWKRGQRGIHLYYWLWQMGLIGIARELHDRHQFDIAHHLTIGVFWMPTFLPLLDIPLIWGPVGGAEITPKQLRSRYKLANQIREHFKSLAVAISTISPLIRWVAGGSAVVLARTRETARALSAFTDNVLLFLETGFDTQDMGQRCNGAPKKSTSDFLILSAGRLIYWKGFDLGVAALAPLLKVFPRSRLAIAGAGPEYQELLRLAKRLGVEESVTFYGQLPRDDLLSLMRQSDVVLHPSTRDGGAWVIMEAMAQGKPVVCLDCGGPAQMITPECGIKVSAHNFKQVVSDLTAALTRLGTDASLRERLARGARERVATTYAWDTLGDRMEEIYQSVLVNAHPHRS